MEDGGQWEDDRNNKWEEEKKKKMTPTYYFRDGLRGILTVVHTDCYTVVSVVGPAESKNTYSQRESITPPSKKLRPHNKIVTT